MVSCNDVLMQIVSREGKDIFYKYQDMFGFTDKTGIDLPGEARLQSRLYAAETRRASGYSLCLDRRYNCYGRIARPYQPVLNGGSYYQPHVVKQILNSQGSVVKKVDPVLVRETVSQSTSDFIKNALFQTVYGTKGTGKAAQVEGYELGGKTGTAEKLPRGNGNYVVSFCGFAPVDHPEVLVYVVIDQPHVEDQPHSTYASEVFAKIMKDEDHERDPSLSQCVPHHRDGGERRGDGTSPGGRHHGQYVPGGRRRADSGGDGSGRILSR